MSVTTSRKGTHRREGSATAFPSIESSESYQRPDLLKQAWSLPVARRYAPLLSQRLGSMCGPCTVANVLRSMGIPARRNPLKPFGMRPMSLEQLVGEAAEVVPDGWQVRAVRPGTVDEFREELRASNREDRRLAANFSRLPLFGRGGGHHSPIGGYLEGEDLVFVLDVNRRFGPWLTTPERFFEAVHTVADRVTGTLRGLARFEASRP